MWYDIYRYKDVTNNPIEYRIPISTLLHNIWVPVCVLIFSKYYEKQDICMSILFWVCTNMHLIKKCSCKPLFYFINYPNSHHFYIQGVSYCFGFFYRAPVTNLLNNLTCTDNFYIAKGWEFWYLNILFKKIIHSTL